MSYLEYLQLGGTAGDAVTTSVPVPEINVTAPKTTQEISAPANTEVSAPEGNKKISDKAIQIFTEHKKKIIIAVAIIVTIIIIIVLAVKLSGGDDDDDDSGGDDDSGNSDAESSALVSDALVQPDCILFGVNRGKICDLPESQRSLCDTESKNWAEENCVTTTRSTSDNNYCIVGGQSNGRLLCDLTDFEARICDNKNLRVNCPRNDTTTAITTRASVQLDSDGCPENKTCYTQSGIRLQYNLCNKISGTVCFDQHGNDLLPFERNCYPTTTAITTTTAQITSTAVNDDNNDRPRNNDSDDDSIVTDRGSDDGNNNNSDDEDNDNTLNVVFSVIIYLVLGILLIYFARKAFKKYRGSSSSSASVPGPAGSYSPNQPSGSSTSGTVRAPSGSFNRGSSRRRSIRGANTSGSSTRGPIRRTYSGSPPSYIESQQNYRQSEQYGPSRPPQSNKPENKEKSLMDYFKYTIKFLKYGFTLLVLIAIGVGISKLVKKDDDDDDDDDDDNNDNTTSTST